MIKRYFKIENYRNLGLEKSEPLLLNTSIEDGKLGNLVILVGPNNSGKSNCLDALLAFGNDDHLSKNDFPDFSTAIKETKLSLAIQDGDSYIGANKIMSYSNETIEEWYSRKGEKNLTTVETDVIITPEAKDFAFRLFTSVPYYTLKAFEITEAARQFGIHLINSVANNWGSNVYVNQQSLLGSKTYDLYRNYTRHNKWNDEASESVIPVLNYAKKQWGLNNWKQNINNIYRSNTEDQIQDLVDRLTKKTERVPANISKGAINILKYFQPQKQSSEIPPDIMKLAIALINLAVSTNKQNIEKNLKNMLSKELNELHKTYTQLKTFPEKDISKLLSEAHDFLSMSMGPRYYINNLSTTKAQLDECIKAFSSISNQEQELQSKIEGFNFRQKANDIKKIFGYAKELWGEEFYNEKLDLNIKAKDVEDYLYQFSTLKTKKVAPEIRDWEKNHNMKLIPNIARFKETKINQDALSIKPSDLGTSNFFENLFKAINYPQNSLISLYEDVKSGSKVTAMLRVTEKEINRKLKKISDQFNKLFFLKENNYEFDIILETNKIEFSLYIGNLPLNLDKQSTGFKWFFNFYFTVIAHKNLSRGDIVIMDEPATNLHVSGIQELRTFIKQYAKESELTFVISTHSPFMIDVDHLEEVRVVSRIGREAVINNKFQVIEGDDLDALKPIKDALTVGRHILLDPNKKTIFVEGITDYCYLTSYKEYVGDIANGLYFLPIQGLDHENILERILKIDRDPTILVDNDHKGNGVKKRADSHKNRDRIEVITLKEIDPDFTVIESLFTDKDKPKDKSFELAVTFKNNFDPANMDEKTNTNFIKLLENIAS